MFNSLRIRLTLIFVVLTVLPLVLVSSLIALRGFETLQNTAVDLQGHQARQASIDLRAFFNERLNELGVLVDVYGFDTLSPEAQRDVLLALLAKQPAYYQLAVVDSTGQEVSRLIRGQVITPNDLQNRADDPVFQAVAEANRPSFSSIYFSEGARDRMIAIALPITDIVSGALKEVLIAEIRFQTVTENVLRNLNLPAGEEVYIVDTNGVVIAHRNPSFVLKETVYALPDTDGRNTGLNGEDVVLAKDTIQIENLTLTSISEIQYSKAIGFATDLVSISALITVITLVIALIVIVWVVSRVVAPITKLSRIAQAIQAGDFSQKSQMNRKDEIGQFAVAFNAMSEAIQHREMDLREQADQLRIATAKAREAARVKGEFLANVSHELRTPLNAIIGFSDMLLAGMSGPLNEKQVHKMTRLKENGIRLLSLINDLLDLTRIEAGRLEMIEKPFSPRLLAERLSAQMESLAVESKLRFDTIVDPALPEEIMGDQKRVEQVVVNLLSNAFKFTKEGSVTLSFSANLTEHTWGVEVVDTGIGIPPHAVNVIFEEFRQLDGSYSRAYKGSGLGLAITRNLVRMMGGKISVKSTLGTGSTFTVVLPLSQQTTLTPQTLELVPG